MCRGEERVCGGAVGEWEKVKERCGMAEGEWEKGRGAVRNGRGRIGERRKGVTDKVEK